MVGNSIDLATADQTLTYARLNFYTDSNGIGRSMDETSFVEATMVESLLTPGLQTSLKFHSFTKTEFKKDLEKLKGQVVDFTITRPILNQVNIRSEMNITQRLFRLEKRSMLDNNNEEFTIQLCDQTLLTDADTLVSWSWKCATPTQITEEVLRRCAKARIGIMEGSRPLRDYFADNIHPFQVVSQQADVALASGDDPSFVHFMTFENMPEGSGDPRGLHHFRSLKQMAQQRPKYEYIRADTGYSGKYSSISYAPDGLRRFAIMSLSFPADFDMLSDVLNGVDGDGKSLLIFRPADKVISLLGNKGGPCGVGAQNISEAISNKNNPSLEGCPTDVEKHLLIRQARMNLLSENDVALRITVPWVTDLHAGDVIRVKIPNPVTGEDSYGSGDYLIATLVHNIRQGGYSTITMDCVSETVSRGEL